MGKLEGKVVVISGGARGQGRQHAVTFAREGADVAIVDVPPRLESVQYPTATRSDLEETVELVENEGRECLAIEGDVRDAEAMEQAGASIFEKFRRIDVVLANAAITTDWPDLVHATVQEWRDVIDVNLNGAWFFCRGMIPHMIHGGRGGSIVITSSLAGFKGMASGTNYVASKHAVVGLMRGLAHELAPHNIRVNTVHPGGVRTPMVINEWFLEKLKQPGLANIRPLLDVPLLEPQDISNAMLWLASDDARYVTGTTIPVDAGMSVR